MRKTAILVCSLALVAFLGSLVSFDGATAGEKSSYVGASKCKMCHKKAEDGEQYVIWEKSKHAQAYATLAGEKAMEIAKKKGIANPQEADECLKCHVTGYGTPAELLGSKYDKTEGVTCEACHGAGSEYYKKSTMVGLTTGEIEPASVGLVLPDEKTCKTCHNEESPTFTGFKFDEMVKKIAHPIPEAKKAEYKTGG
ncbi:MAG: multiheme c-type cytochrome [Candidatus Latescibacterota bacterium]|jgi:hypothetical protein